MHKMHVAVVGCGHGEIDKIYEVIENIEKGQNIKVSIVLCCGDFQSVRNMTDLRCMACPIKYQQMHDFHRYYSGEKTAPILTLFIGGNHEASNFLQEVPYGGWVAPNIFYLGYTGVFRYGSLRIAGISGIYKGNDYLKGRFESPPYDQSSMRSVYHYRNLDILRLKQLNEHVNIVLSHDWPKGIHNYGDVNKLLRKKPFFQQEVENDALGSRPLFEILCKLKPSYWFSAHMHVKFEAVVREESSESCNEAVPNEHDNDVTPSSAPQNHQSQRMTKFLALDKVLPRRQFLQIIEVENEIPVEDLKLQYDVEWLAILKSTDHLVSSKSSTVFMPGPGFNARYDFTPTKEELDKVLEMFAGNPDVPLNFTQTASPHQPEEQPQRAFPIINPQTSDFCNKFGITDPITSVIANGDRRHNSSFLLQHDDSDMERFQSQLDITMNSTHPTESLNPDEISLDNDEEDESNLEDENKSRNSQLCTDMKSPIASLSDLSEANKSGTRRRKLELPAPKCAIGESEDVEVANSCEAVDANELKLLQSVLGPSTPDTESTACSSVENTDNFFVIDRQGDPSNFPKKRRNASFYGDDG